MSPEVIVPGRYVDHTFIPDGPLPDTEGNAELHIRPTLPTQTVSIFDLFGKAARLRSAADIAAQIEEERMAWGEQ